MFIFHKNGKGIDMSTFVAGVQYNDFQGSVAGDKADTKSLLKHLIDKGVAQKGEILSGFRFGFSGNDGRAIDTITLVVYLFKTEEFVKKPKKLRAIEVELPTAELFSFFKRFDLVMMNKSQEFDEDTIIDGPHYD
jgi:hypothetical protein